MVVSFDSSRFVGYSFLRWYWMAAFDRRCYFTANQSNEPVNIEVELWSLVESRSLIVTSGRLFVCLPPGSRSCDA